MHNKNPNLNLQDLIFHEQNQRNHPQDDNVAILSKEYTINPILDSTASHVSLRLITCVRQLCPQGMSMRTLIGQSAMIHFGALNFGAIRNEKSLVRRLMTKYEEGCC